MKRSTKEHCRSIIKSKQGVLFAVAEPGTGKTSMIKQIAKEEEWMPIVIHLAQVDSSEIGGIPQATMYTMGNGTKIGTMEYFAPKWFALANDAKNITNPDTGKKYKGAIFFFDELNRALLEQRNCALRLLLDHMVDYDKLLADHVYYCAAGNLGEEDGTEVEEFDTALNNRLFHYRYEMSFKEWCENFANVTDKQSKQPQFSPILKEFLGTVGQDYIFKKPENGKPQFPTYRTWTFFSEFMRVSNDGVHPAEEQILEYASQFASGYVGGPASSRLIAYLKEKIETSRTISMKDILTDYSKVKPLIAKVNRSKISLLVQELRKMELNSFSKAEVNNLKLFLRDIDIDEAVSYLTELMDDEKYLDRDGKKSSNFDILHKEFWEECKKVLDALAKEFAEEEKKAEEKAKEEKAKKK